jgi:multimeric flavodoxin WrbA
MNITILNGNPTPDNQPFEDYLSELSDSWISDGHQIKRLDLRTMKINYCTGCWHCWVKTPGQCSSQDQSLDVCRAVIHSDLTLWASPIIMGFPSALLKKVTDKLIPLVHPYIVVDQGEAHHLARYEHYPRFGLLLENSADTDEEDIEIIREIFSRTALNMKSSLAFSKTTNVPVSEVSNAINDL